MALRPEEPARTKPRVLPAGPQTPSEARWFLREALKDHDATVDMAAAALLTGELASNEARHGGEPIEMSVNFEHDGLRVSVHDRGSGFDPADEAIRRGGWACGSLTRSHPIGVERDEEGTQVWFKI